MRSRQRSPDRAPARIALTLTLVAGLVDAAAFLSLERVFVANQSGNCVLLAIGLAALLPIGGPRPALPIEAHGPLVSLAAFCAGAAFAGWLTGARGPRRLAAFRPLIAAEVLLLAVAAAAPWPGWARAAVTAAAMGVQTVQAVRLKLAGVTTTVVTGTLASLFARLIDSPARRQGADTLALVWLLYTVGAALGAAGARLWSFSVICWCAVALAVLRAITDRPPDQ